MESGLSESPSSDSEYHEPMEYNNNMEVTQRAPEPETFLPQPPPPPPGLTKLEVQNLIETHVRPLRDAITLQSSDLANRFEGLNQAIGQLEQRIAEASKPPDLSNWADRFDTFQELIGQLQQRVEDATKPPQDPKPEPSKWKRSLTIESNESQYSIGNPSGCTSFALEGCLRILSGFEPSADLIGEILKYYQFKIPFHQSFDEVLKSENRYAKAFVTLDNWTGLLKDLSRQLEQIAEKYKQELPIGVLLTRSPESICLCLLDDKTFVIWDSHKRDNTRGAYFKIDKSLTKITSYLKTIMPTVDDDGFGGYQMEMLNMAELVVVRRDLRVKFADLPPIDNIKLLKAEYDRQIADLKGELEKQRRETAELKTALATAHEEIRSLQQASDTQFEGFRQMVDGLRAEIGEAKSGVKEKCSVCHEEVANGDNGEAYFVAPRCQHAMCFNCARKYFGLWPKRKLAYPITCKECQEPLPIHCIRTVLEPNGKPMAAVERGYDDLENEID